ARWERQADEEAECGAPASERERHTALLAERRREQAALGLRRQRPERRAAQPADQPAIGIRSQERRRRELVVAGAERHEATRDHGAGAKAFRRLLEHDDCLCARRVEPQRYLQQPAVDELLPP